MLQKSHTLITGFNTQGCRKVRFARTAFTKEYYIFILFNPDIS